MKDFLTDFYNKVLSFFQAEKVEGENTKETAKNRLKLVLMQDRSNLEPETMAQLREELIEVISKYIVIDKESLGLNLDGDGESMALMLNIPVIRAKTPEEIREALEAAAKQKAEKSTQEDEDNTEDNPDENDGDDSEDVQSETEVEAHEENGGDENADAECADENSDTCPQDDAKAEDESVISETETEVENQKEKSVQNTKPRNNK